MPPLPVLIALFAFEAAVLFISASRARREAVRRRRVHCPLTGGMARLQVAPPLARGAPETIVRCSLVAKHQISNCGEPCVRRRV